MIHKIITPEEVATLLNDEETLLIDTRPSAQFVYGFIPGSISAPLHNKYAHEYLSAMDAGIPIVLICLPEEIISNTGWFENLGIQNIKGILAGGYTQWEKLHSRKKDMIIEIEPDELAMDLPHDDALLAVDVRTPTEYGDGHISGAFNLPLNDMKDPAGIAMLPETANLYIYCSDGTRSVMAASVLKSHGIHELRVVAANWDSISTTNGIEIDKDPAQLN